VSILSYASSMRPKPTNGPSSISETFSATNDARLLRLTFSLVIATGLACGLYASFGARGLYSDGAALLVVIYETKSFLLSDTAAIVDILRQIPIVLLTRFMPATLFECGQVFSF